MDVGRAHSHYHLAGTIFPPLTVAWRACAKLLYHLLLT